LLLVAFAVLQGIASHEPAPTVDVNKAAKGDKAFINLLREWKRSLKRVGVSVAIAACYI
jgi:hypothetical protein